MFQRIQLVTLLLAISKQVVYSANEDSILEPGRNTNIMSLILTNSFCSTVFFFQVTLQVIIIIIIRLQTEYNFAVK